MKGSFYRLTDYQFLNRTHITDLVPEATLKAFTETIKKSRTET